MDYFIQATNINKGQLLEELLNDLAVRWEGFDAKSDCFTPVTLRNVLNVFDFDAPADYDTVVFLVPEKVAFTGVYAPDLEKTEYRQTTSGVWVRQSDLESLSMIYFSR